MCDFPDVSPTLPDSDVQGLVNPPRFKGRGKEGQGQGKNFMTLNKPLPF
jgi:hypothetical protein